MNQGNNEFGANEREEVEGEDFDQKSRRQIDTISEELKRIAHQPLSELRKSVEFRTSITPPKRLTDLGVPPKVTQMVIEICLIVEKNRGSTADIFFFLFDDHETYNNMSKKKTRMKKKKRKKNEKLTNEETEHMKLLLELLEYIRSGNRTEVGKFLRYFRDTFEPYAYNNLPIVAACAYGQLEIIKFLQTQSPRVNPSVCKDIGVISAGRRGHLGVIKYLKKSEHRVDLTARNNALLLNALYGMHIDIIKYLTQEYENVTSVNTRDFEVFKHVGKSGNLELIDHFCEDYQNELENPMRYGWMLLSCAINGHELGINHILLRAEKLQESENNEDIISSVWVNKSLVRTAEEGHVHCVQYLVRSHENISTKISPKAVKDALFGSIRHKQQDVLMYFLDLCLSPDENSENPRIKNILRDILNTNCLEILALMTEHQMNVTPDIILKLLQAGKVPITWTSLESVLKAVEYYLPNVILMEGIVQIFSSLLLLSSTPEEHEEEFKTQYSSLLISILSSTSFSSHKYLSFMRLTLTKWVSAESHGHNKKIYCDMIKSYDDHPEKETIFARWGLFGKIPVIDLESGLDMDDPKFRLDELDYMFLVATQIGVVWNFTTYSIWDEDEMLKNIPFLPEDLAKAAIKLYKKKRKVMDFEDVNLVNVVCELITREDKSVLEYLLDGPMEEQLEKYYSSHEVVKTLRREKNRTDREMYISKVIPDLEIVLSEEVFKGSEFQNLEFQKNKQQQQQQEEENEGEMEEDYADYENIPIVYLCPSFRLQLEGFLGGLELQKEEYTSQIIQVFNSFPEDEVEDIKTYEEQYFLKTQKNLIIHSSFHNALCFQTFDQVVTDLMIQYLSTIKINEQDYCFPKKMLEVCFMMASENGFLETLKLLLIPQQQQQQQQQQENLILPNCNDNYAFRWACRNGHIEVVEFLLSEEQQERYEINPCDKNNEAILNCVRFGHTEVLQFLISHERFKESLEDKNLVEQIIITAAKFEQIEILGVLETFLLDDENYTSLSSFIKWDELLSPKSEEEDEDKNMKLTFGENMQNLRFFNTLKIACVLLDEETIEDLICEKYLSLYQLLTPHKLTIILRLISTRPQKEELLEFLIQTYNDGVNQNRNISKGNDYVFRWACSCCEISIVKILSKMTDENGGKCVNPSACMEESLIFSSRWGNHNIVQKLMKSVETSARNNLSIELACERGQAQIVELLVQDNNVMENYVTEQISHRRIQDYLFQKYNSLLEVKNISQKIMKVWNMGWYSGLYGTWWVRTMLLDCYHLKFMPTKKLRDEHISQLLLDRKDVKIYRIEGDENKIISFTEEIISKQQFQKNSKSWEELEKENDNNDDHKMAWIVLEERKGFEIHESLYSSGYIYSSETFHDWILREIPPELEKMKKWAQEKGLRIPDDDAEEEEEEDSGQEEELFYSAKCEEWIQNKYDFLNIRFGMEIPEWNSDDEENNFDDDPSKKKIDM